MGDMALHSSLQAETDAQAAAVAWLLDEVRALDPAFRRVARLAARLTGSPVAAFTLVSREVTVVRAAEGMEVGPAPESHAAACRDCVASQAEVRGQGFVALPVRAPGEVAIGTLSVAGTPSLGDDASEVLLELRDLLEEVVAVALDSPRDDVTGLPSGKQLEEDLEREWLRARRADRPITVLNVEIQGLDGTADEVDPVLRAVTTALRASLRSAVDAIGRTGRRQLVLVLADCDEHGAVVVADRLRAAVAGLAVPGVAAIVGGAVARPADDDESAGAMLHRAADAGRRAGPELAIVSSGRLLVHRVLARA